MIKICMCGASENDEHRFYCPYPIYAGTLADVDAWEAARLAKISARAAARGGEPPDILKSAEVLKVLGLCDK